MKIALIGDGKMSKAIAPLADGAWAFVTVMLGAATTAMAPESRGNG